MSSDAGTDEMTPESFRACLERSFADEPSVPETATYAAAGRRRLARRWSLAAGACVLAVIAVPVSISAIGGSLDDGRDRGRTAAIEPQVPQGWRIVSADGSSFAVPSSWATGSPTQWCVSELPGSPPLVLVPGDQFSSAVDCIAPQRWYGAELASDETKSSGLTPEPVRYQAAGEGGSLFPDGAWVAQVDASKGWVLIVATDSRDTTQKVLDSLRVD